MNPSLSGTVGSTPVRDRAMALLMSLLMIAGAMLTMAPATVLAIEPGEPDCGPRPIDLVLVLDRSGSMNTDTIPGSGTKTRLAWAQEAATNLVNGFDGAGGVGAGGLHRIGLTTFGSTTASNAVTLASASNAATINAAISGITANGGTPFNLGMSTGAGNMTAGKRAMHEGVAVAHVMVFLSDGNPDPDSYTPTAGQTSTYLAAAETAYSVAIGADGGDLGSGGTGVSYALMRTIAKPAYVNDANPGGFRAVTSASGLPALFDALLEEITCPAIDIEKSANPTQLPFGGGPVVYSYDVTNTLDGAPLLNVTVTDDKCAPVTYVSGDTNGDSKLQYGEIWKYTCSTTLTQDTTNIGTAQGSYAGQSFTDQDTATVTILPPAGKLEVQKALSPTGDGGLVNLLIDGVAKATNVGHGGTTGEQAVTTGNHTVAESAGTGTDLANYQSAISCVDQAKQGAAVSTTGSAPSWTVNVANGADVLCTITNTRETGKLQVVKDLTPPTDPGLFNLQIDGVTHAANVGDGGDTGEKTVNTGIHTVGETAGTATSLANYDASITCKADNGNGATVAAGSTAGPLNVNVTHGSDILCTIANARQTGKLTVVKDLNPANDPGLFNLRINGEIAAPNVGDGGTTGAWTVATGTHTVSETAGTGTTLGDYTSSIDCRDQAGASVASANGAGPLNVPVGADDEIVCTITNARDTGSIQVLKDLDPADDPGLFNLQIDGVTRAANVGDGGDTGKHDVATGTHSVGEIAGAGTSLADYDASIVCRADGGTGATIASGSSSGPLNVNVTKGADIVCVISNARQTGTLEVVKDLNPADDPGRFDLRIDGSVHRDEAGDGESTGPVTVNTGTHVIGESADGETSLPDYTYAASCWDGETELDVEQGSGANWSVDVADGAEVVCTITNTRKTGTLTVLKDLDPANDPGRFDLLIDGGTEASSVGDGGSTGAVTLPTGSHSVAEEAAGGTSLANYASSIECRSNGGQGAIVAVGAGAGPLAVEVTHQANIVCVISNDRVSVGFDKASDHDDEAVEPGELIHFTLTVSVNNGTATDVEVSDELPAGLSYVTGSADPSAGFSVNGQELTWNAGNLAAGTHTFEYDARVDADASGSLTNLGCVDADQNDELVCDQTTHRVQDLDVTKTNDTEGTVLPGDVIGYTLRLDVTNGPIDDVTIVDQLPDGIGEPFDISDGGTYDAGTNRITWMLTDVSDGDELTYSAVVSASASAGEYTNVATITDGPCIGDDCEDDSTVTVRVPGLAIEKEADAETITISGPADDRVASPSVVTWTLSWTLADGPVTNVVITDDLPAGLVFLDATDGGTFADGTVTWMFGTLTEDGSVSFRTTVDPTSISLLAPTVNVAVIDSDETDPEAGEDSVRVVVEPPPQGGTPTPKPDLPDTAMDAPTGPTGLPIWLLVGLMAASIGMRLGAAALGRRR